MSDKNTITMKITFESNKILIQREIESMKNDELKKNTLKLELSVARIFHKVLNKARIVEIFEKTDYELLGSMLYKILGIHDEIKEFFINILAEIIRDPESRCRVLLEFKEDINELASLPWEYLLIPEHGKRNIRSFFLAADRRKQFDFIRYLDVDSNRFKSYSLEDQKEINVIVIVSNADNKPVDELKIAEVFKRLHLKNQIKNKKGKILFSKFNSHKIENPTKENLARKLKSAIDDIVGPYVIHFYGHAEMRKDGPYIGLIGDDGNVDWVKNDYFVEMFRDIKLPLLAFMQACESGQVNEDGEGIGVGLVRMGVPAVVAMQNEVTPDVSLAFVEKLYNSLLEGESIAHSVTIGRYYLGCEHEKDHTKFDEHYDNNTFGTPVIFMNTSKSKHLLPKIDKEVILVPKKNKRCPICGHRYRTTDLVKCNWNFCSGILVEEEEKGDTAASVSSSPDHRPLSNQ